MILAAFLDSLTKLDPRVQIRNSATFALYVGSIFTTIVGLAWRATFMLEIAAWLWLSVLLANFADAVAVEWAKARATRLGSIGGRTQAKRLLGTNRSEYRLVEAQTLRRGDVVLVEADEIIPADGTVIEGAASVSEGRLPVSRRRYCARRTEPMRSCAAAPRCSPTGSLFG